MTTKLRLWLLLLLTTAGIISASAQQKKLSLESFALDPFDLSAQNERYLRMVGDEKPMAIIKVSSSPLDSLQKYTFDFGYIAHQVDTTNHDDGMLWVYVARNAKIVTIRRAGYNTIFKHSLGTTIEAGRTYNMVLFAEVPKPINNTVPTISKSDSTLLPLSTRQNDLTILQTNNNQTLAHRENTKKKKWGKVYLQAGVQAGSLRAATATVGAYLGGFNIEATYGLGLSKSEAIYWNHDTDPTANSIECSYKPTLMGIKLGYGIDATSSLRLTPQAGLTVVNISASETTSKGNATSLAIGLRAELLLATHFSLFAAPEYNAAISQSDTYSRLKEVSSKIKSWSNGFNVRAGLCLSF